MSITFDLVGNSPLCCRSLRTQPKDVMVTRAEIAALAGVSPGVVSYVINGGPRPVSESTRNRVLSAIRQLNYQPNAVASSLRRGTTRTIGLLLEDPHNAYFSELATGVTNHFWRAGYSTTVAIVERDRPGRRRALSTFVSQQLDGLILLSTDAVQDLRLLGTDIPVVLLDRADPASLVSSVTVDNVNDAAQGVEYLQHLGHSQIACLAGPKHLAISQERLQGWRNQQTLGGFPCGESLIVHSDFSASGGAAALTTLMLRKQVRPTAVFISTDVQALGALHACYEMGLRVPEDVSVVTFDGTWMSQVAIPTLTAVQQPLDAIASTAVTTLLERISSPGLPHQHHVLRSRVVPGRSSRPIG